MFSATRAAARVGAVFDTPFAMSWDGARLLLTGSVDEYALSDLRARLDDLIGVYSVLVVDVSGVDYLPSAGLGVLARATASPGCEVRLLAAAGSEAHRMLEITGIPHRTV